MTNQAKVKCEIYLAMNEDGGWVVTNDETEALVKLGEDEGGYVGRVVKLVVTMTPPEMPEIAVDVPDEAGQTADVTIAEGDAA